MEPEKQKETQYYEYLIARYPIDFFTEFPDCGVKNKPY